MGDTMTRYIPIFLSFFLTCGIGAYAWRHRFTPGVRPFIYLSFVEVSWMAGYILEISSPTLAGKLFWDDFQFIGSLYVPYWLLVFAYEYTGNGDMLSVRVRRILIALPAVFLFLLYTNPIHGWVRTPTARIIPGAPFDVLLYDFTRVMWVSFIYSYLAYVVAVVIFIRNLQRVNRLFQMQSWIIILGFSFPIFGSIPGMAGVLLFGQRDITPYTFGIANLLYFWGLFRIGLFNVAPIARAAVFEYMSDIVVVLDADSRVVDINPAASIGLGKKAPEVLGRHALEMIAGQPDLIALFENSDSIRRDVYYDSWDGYRYVLDALWTPLNDRTGRTIGRLFVARDITLNRRMEESLRRSNEDLESRVRMRTRELEQANSELEQKNAELERFTYTVSHDLKSPLVTIKGYLGYLRKDIKDGNSERLKKDTERIANAVEQMQKLLNDLLELSRVGRFVIPMQPISFEELTREALGLVQIQLEEKKVAVQIQPGLPVVLCEKMRLVEVIQNLVENAIKFMGAQPKPQIQIGVMQDDSDAFIFFVKDNGIGIAPKYHEQIFGLFNRLDPTIEGTGVGLALVKRIIEFHGGRIWVESQLGQGTAFYFTLNTDKISADQL